MFFPSCQSSVVLAQMVWKMADSSRHAHTVDRTHSIGWEIAAFRLVYQLIKGPELPTARAPAIIVLVGSLSSISVPPVRML